MFFEGANAYITMSYAITTVVFAILIIWVMSERSRLKKALSDLEAQGITRNSQNGPSDQ